MAASSGTNKHRVVCIVWYEIDLFTVQYIWPRSYCGQGTDHKRIIQGVGIPAKLGEIERDAVEFGQKNRDKLLNSVYCGLVQLRALLWWKGH